MSKIEACNISSLSHGVSQCLTDSDRPLRGRPDTFLPFMKYWWARVVHAFFFGVCKFLATPIMDTFLSHI